MKAILCIEERGYDRGGGNLFILGKPWKKGPAPGEVVRAYKARKRDRKEEHGRPAVKKKKRGLDGLREQRTENRARARRLSGFRWRPDGFHLGWRWVWR